MITIRRLADTEFGLQISSNKAPSPGAFLFSAVHSIRMSTHPFYQLKETDCTGLDVQVLRPARKITFDFRMHQFLDQGWQTLPKRIHFDIQEEQVWRMDRRWKVWSEHGFLFSPDDKIVLESFSFPYVTEAAHHLKQAYEKARPAKTQHLEGSVFLFSNVGYSNFYHVITELLVRLEFLDHLHIQPRVLVMEDSPSFVWEGLRLLGVTEEKIIRQRPDTVYTADEWIGGNYGMNFIPDRFSWLRQKLVPEEEELVRSMHIERKPGLPRSAKDTSASSEKFSVHGYEVVRTEEKTLQEQIQHSSSSFFISGIHGAGLSNILWMRDPRLVELRPRGYDNRCYLHLALCCGAKDFWLYEEEHSGSTMILDVNLDRLDTALATLV